MKCPIRRPGLRALSLPAALAAVLACATLLTASPPALADSPGLTPVRVAGADRYATAVALSQQSFPTGSDVVVVVNALTFADALSAAPAAGILGAPILPTSANALPAVVAAEIGRLHASTALVVGGSSAVGAPVVTALQNLGVTVARASGADRYATAAAVATSVVAGESTSEVVIASGTTFADGLTGGAYGAATGAPLLLTNPTTLPPATANALSQLRPSTITVLGGPNAVSDAVLAALTSYTSPGGTVRRIWGADRYATAAAVQKALWTSAPTALLATGSTFPDALAAGALGAPILLTHPGCLPAATADALGSWKTTSTVAVGDTGVVSNAAASGARCP